ncbi:acyl-CoA dehydrogenase family protein [Dactylosporangium sp. NPDC000555]|uniref:acyl-CoA dehydrogenase family protein n=1 Tax=Dactylosporangium sp. NPDC000555 TaxID=3154260 RepID=UPI003330E557
MEFELDDQQRAWREQVRSFLAENFTPELLRLRKERGYESDNELLRDFRRKVGEKGWFGLNWPKEYGGLGLGPIYQHILVNEFEYWGAPGPDLTVTSVAPMIMRYGTEHNKEEWLPPIARGEITCAVGYSEPNAGTDLASLKTRAELDGDEWVINGQKIWNSMAHMATHEWLCVRTDPDAPRHRGISVIMVPIDTPGIEVRPIITWDDFRTNEAFFTDVRVPRTNLIGEPNRGWQYITGALDLERGALTNAGDLRRAVDEVIEAARLVLPDGTRPMDQPDVRRRIAQLEADVDVAVLMGLEAASLLETGQIPTVAVTAEKIFSSELRQRIADLGTTMLGMSGVLDRGDPHAVPGGGFEKLYRSAPLLRFGGGANEVLRDVIAQRGHGMPGYGR